MYGRDLCHIQRPAACGAAGAAGTAGGQGQPRPSEDVQPDPALERRGRFCPHSGGVCKDVRALRHRREGTWVLFRVRWDRLLVVSPVFQCIPRLHRAGGDRQRAPGAVPAASGGLGPLRTDHDRLSHCGYPAAQNTDGLRGRGLRWLSPVPGSAPPGKPAQLSAASETAGGISGGGG